MEQAKSNASALAGLEDITTAPESDAKQATKAHKQEVDVSAIVAQVRAELAAAGNEQIEELKRQLRAKDEENAALKKAADEAAAKQLEDQHARGANESRASSKERWLITLDEARDQNEVDPVFVQVNGRGYSIKRGKPVAVPREVISVLNDAVEAKAIPQKDANDMPNGFTVRNARRFPFIVHGKVVDKDGKELKLDNPGGNSVAL